MFGHVLYPNPRPQSVTDWFYVYTDLPSLEFIVNGLMLGIPYYVWAYS